MDGTLSRPSSTGMGGGSTTTTHGGKQSREDSHQLVLEQLQLAQVLLVRRVQRSDHDVQRQVVHVRGLQRHAGKAPRQAQLHLHTEEYAHVRSDWRHDSHQQYCAAVTNILPAPRQPLIQPIGACCFACAHRLHTAVVQDEARKYLSTSAVFTKVYTIFSVPIRLVRGR